MATIQQTMNQLMEADKKVNMDGENCPAATQDITINLKNRAKAISSAAYGPENPDLPNTKFWQDKADQWEVSIEDAKMSRCGNCSAFNQDDSMLQCIKDGIGNESGGADEVVDQADLGYCEIFDFKCAASRVCDAWIPEGDDYMGKDNNAMEGEDDTTPMVVIRIGTKK